jgi:PTS system fructose-specific IIC component
MEGANTGILDPNHPGKTLIISDVSLGIVAAIIMGFSAGILVNYFNRFKYHKYIKPIVPVIIIPVIVTSLLVFPFIFGVSGLLGTLIN